MARIEYQLGDATAPVGKANKIVCHICNDIGGWGKGFVLAISKHWPQPEANYRQWHRERKTNDFALGALQLVKVEADIWVANMIAQHETARKGVVSRDALPPIRYKAVEVALAKLALEAKRLKASIHMPRIGCGLAGGTWDKIEPIIHRTLCMNEIEVTVYDLV
jgi:O-acetyl-ADP-ribose deacetylase (regulator of RNase III)